MKTQEIRGRAATLVAGLAALILPMVAQAESFTYTDFSTNSLDSNPLQINGNAAAPVIGAEGTPVLRLTAAQDNQAGSAFSLNTIQLGSNASFSTAFAFQLTDGGGIQDGTTNPLGADGIVFVLNTVANNVGSSGQGVGYQGLPSSVGVKFDTWQDNAASYPQDSDPNGNFVAVYTNGSIETAGYVPFSTNNPTTEPQYYSPPTSMKNGDIWYAWIDYNGQTAELDVRLSDGVNVRPLNPQLSQTIVLSAPSILGSSPAVFAGFTSATGGAYDNTDVLIWQFSGSFQPIGVPFIAAVPDQSVEMGSVLLVTNTALDPILPARQVTFSLGAGAPAGAGISASGIFEWAPTCEQGSTTNVITVWATDNGTPALSNSISFTVTVSPCVQVTVGSGTVLLGQNASLPVTLLSTVSLTNLSFSLATLAGRFTNWGVTSANSAVVTATAQTAGTSEPQFSFAAPNGQTLPGASLLGTISVEAMNLPDSSAFAPLTVTNIVATASNNTAAAPVFGQGGVLALIGIQPLLQASLTNPANALLTFYGKPGVSYAIMANTSLSSASSWITLTNITLTNTLYFINSGPPTNPMEFYRALQQ